MPPLQTARSTLFLAELGERFSQAQDLHISWARNLLPAFTRAKFHVEFARNVLHPRRRHAPNPLQAMKVSVRRSVISDERAAARHETALLTVSSLASTGHQQCHHRTHHLHEYDNQPAPFSSTMGTAQLSSVPVIPLIPRAESQLAEESQVPALPPLPQEMHFTLPPLDSSNIPFASQQSPRPLSTASATFGPLPIQALSSEALYTYNSTFPENQYELANALYQLPPPSGSPVDTLFSTSSGSAASSYYTGTPSPPPMSAYSEEPSSLPPAAPQLTANFDFTSWENLHSVSWFNSLPDPTLSLPLFEVPEISYKHLVALKDREPLDWNGRWASDLTF